MISQQTEPDLYTQRGVPDEDREQWEDYRDALRDAGVEPPPPLWALTVDGFPPYGKLRLTPVMPTHPAYVPPEFSDDDKDECELLLSLYS